MARKKLTSIAAKQLSKLGAAQGGKARAASLTEEERREIASNAVKARWAKVKGVPISAIGKNEQVSPLAKLAPPVEAGLPISLFRGELEMGGISFSCHVLNNGKRVIVQREIVKALTGNVSGDLKARLSAVAISKYINLE